MDKKEEKEAGKLQGKEKDTRNERETVTERE